jgi:3alpha(or 20beta)-hydroxysteroid dehydrogenase
MSGDRRLTGKVALVTGAAQGIGAAVARKLAAHGAQVAIADIQAERGEALARELGAALARELGAAAVFLRLDVTQLDAWQGGVAEIERRFGRLDVLVNNAGGGAGGAIDGESLADHERILRLNVTGVWAGIKSVIALMAAGGGGSVINISSIDGLAGVAGLSTYVATKHAVTGLTRSLALELGGRGIRVNSVHPGIIETPLVKASPVQERLRKAIARQPIPRMGRPEEIANAVLFFASDESSYCTGASLVVDGGHLAGPYRDPVGS